MGLPFRPLTNTTATVAPVTAVPDRWFAPSYLVRLLLKSPVPAEKYLCERQSVRCRDQSENTIEFEGLAVLIADVTEGPCG